MLVSDPCYDRVDETDRLQAVVQVKPGIWLAEVEISDEQDWGHRVAELRAWTDPIRASFWEWYSNCGVDSGQLGFFDFYKYPIGVNGYEAKYEDQNNWYKKACNETFNQNDRTLKAGIVEGMGVNSSSGFGDGGYDVYVKKDNDGNVVAIKAVFIPEDGEDDYD